MTKKFNVGDKVRILDAKGISCAVAEAKAFVEDAKNFTGSITNRPGYKYDETGRIVCDVTFEVNPKKRVVVALLKDQVGDKNVRAKAIAKCAPDDVFNADIGKAIALGRALGLDVKRFEQAVKPTEVVVGTAFKSQTNAGNSFEYRNVTLVTNDRYWGYDTRRNSECFVYKDAATRFGEYARPIIIDDTDAQY